MSVNTHSLSSLSDLSQSLRFPSLSLQSNITAINHVHAVYIHSSKLNLTCEQDPKQLTERLI